jgi:murein DD-endopeptidase MepM/ murein hydrolase activator NlpD
MRVVKTNHESVNIRQTAGGSKVVGRLKIGNIAKLIGNENAGGYNWHEIEFNNIKGFVRSDVVFVEEQTTYDMIRPMAGAIRSKFGNRIHPVTKEAGRFHNGVDIAAPIGREIVSPADGLVLDVYTTEFGGKSLIVLHDNGLESRMCHLDDWRVLKGARVLQGQVIAINGNTGRSTGPHLHYGIRLAGNYIDPETIIKF